VGNFTKRGAAIGDAPKWRQTIRSDYGCELPPEKEGCIFSIEFVFSKNAGAILTDGKYQSRAGE